MNAAQASAMAKVFSSEVAMRTTVEAVQVHGGYGYVKEYHVERLMRDAEDSLRSTRVPARCNGS